MLNTATSVSFCGMECGFPDREERIFRLKDLKESVLGKQRPKLRKEKPTKS